MGKNRDYCFRHAKMYEGWQCPYCADEEERGKTSKAAPNAKVTAAQPALAGKQAQQDQTQRSAYRTPSREEAKALAEQAEGMLLGGAARESLDLADLAIDGDPKNIHAYIVGARAARILRDSSREREMIEEAVKLLRTPEFGATSQWYHEVLKYARDGKLVNQLARAFIAARKWPGNEALPMVRAMVARNAISEALLILDDLPHTERSLSTCAYSMQLTGRTFGRSDPDLQAYLARVSAERRNNLLAEYKAVEEGGFAPSTVAAIKDAIRTRYNQWVPDLEYLVGKQARDLAAHELAPQCVGPAASLGVRIALGILVGGIVLTLVAGSVLFLALGVVLGVVGGAIGFVTGRENELKRLLPNRVSALEDELTDAERRNWEALLRDDTYVAGRTGSEDAPPPDTCPFCGTTIEGGAPQCHQCGGMLAEIVPDQASSEGQADPGTPAGAAALGEAAGEQTPPAEASASGEAIPPATPPPDDGPGRVAG